MSEEIVIKRKIYGKNSFTNVIDTSFKQLVPPVDSSKEANLTDVNKFFQDYDSLFYDIPVSGSLTSHEELVKRSSDYIGKSITDLQEEITNLREENVSLKNQLFIISQNI